MDLAQLCCQRRVSSCIPTPSQCCRRDNRARSISTLARPQARTCLSRCVYSSGRKTSFNPRFRFSGAGSSLRWLCEISNTTSRDVAENGVSQCQTVLDPFGGSGTTLIAAEKTGRRARLIELDPKYVDVIVRRWQSYTGDQAVRESDGELFICGDNTANNRSASGSDRNSRVVQPLTT